MYHQLVKIGDDSQRKNWVYHLNLYSVDEFLEFVQWAYVTYGLEGQYEPLFDIRMGFDGRGEPSVQYFIRANLDGNQALRWVLRWGTGKTPD